MKWKYPEMNSVDFLFEVVFDLVVTFTLSVDLLNNLLKFLLNQVDKDGHENLYLNRRGEKMLLEGNSVMFEGLFVFAFHLFFLCPWIHTHFYHTKTSISIQACRC